MELHRATEPGVRLFHGLDDPVRRARNDFNAGRNAINGLMMAGVHAAKAIHGLLPPPALRPDDLVRERVWFRIAVTVQMRNQRAAKRDVHHLDPTANAEHGLVTLDQFAQYIDFHLIAHLVRAADLPPQCRGLPRRKNLRKTTAAAG